MPTLKTKDGVEIFYKDWGSGQPIVFSHGWPLSGDDWDPQMLFFLSKGYRDSSTTIRLTPTAIFQLRLRKPTFFIPAIPIGMEFIPS
jgi:pimeloyl-ACP methyl ester carboxylesterase